MVDTIAILLKDVDEDEKRKYTLDDSLSLILEERYVKYITPFAKHIALINPRHSPEQIHLIMNSVNGVVLPGGATNVYTISESKQVSTAYTNATKIIIDYAIQQYHDGHPIPILGICLGFEAMVAAVAGLASIEGMDKCLNYNSNVFPMCPLSQSRIYSKLSQQSLHILFDTSSVFYNHYYSVKYESENKMSSVYKCVGKSLSADGKEECISMIEGKEAPLYGLQFHPEVSQCSYFNEKCLLCPVVNKESELLAKELLSIFIDECKKRVVLSHDIQLIEKLKGEPKVNQWNGEICIMWKEF